MGQTMIERMARSDAAFDGRTFDALGRADKRRYMDRCRAAIEAMRDPSPQMVKAACKSLSPERRPTPERVSVRAKHAIRYQAMIDAALNEETE